MNLLLLHPDDLMDEQTAIIKDRRLKHLTKIVKIVEGTVLAAGIINGNLGTATVSKLSSSSAVFTLSLPDKPPAPSPCTLILALPRPLMLKRILQSITALGVKSIHLIHSDKVEKSYWSSSDLANETIQQQLYLGLEQAMDTALPTIHTHTKFHQFVSDVLPSINPEAKRLLAQPNAATPCPANIASPSVLAIGPEGGFTTKEKKVFVDAGFEAVNLGARVLRVETAVSALLGRINPI